MLSRAFFRVSGRCHACQLFTAQFSSTSTSKGGVYLYVEFPGLSVQSDDEVPWQEINVEMKTYKGLLNKTWLSGIDKDTSGGFYEFDNKENCEYYIENFCKGVNEKRFGVKGIYKIYDKSAFKDASIGMNSPFLLKDCKQEK